MLDDLQISIARAAERRARRRLEKGCAEDLLALEGLFQHLSAGRSGWNTSVKAVSDNANVRFRARFRMYAEAVWESESKLVATPRRVALPRLHLNDTSIPASWEELRAALEREVYAAQQKLVRRVIASIARSRSARALRS
jgi:hypothetical protein